MTSNQTVPHMLHDGNCKAQGEAEPMNQESRRYVVSIQAQSFRKKTRYHWMICWENNPDELISWGHAPTHELAESEALNEVRDLTSGLTQGGRVASTCYSAIHHC
jgi:hypothetical protein